jgi:predicted Rossmann fold flavoprotein
MTLKRTIVIGGGAAGLIAAGRAAQLGAEVILLEKMARTGRKIGISGKGRCNLTNTAPVEDFLTRFGSNGRFLRQCFQLFFHPELTRFFTEHNLPLVVERGGRVFPASGRALDVVQVCNDWLEENGVTIRRNTPASAIIVDGGAVAGVKAGSLTLTGGNVILATGGKSYPRTGSSGDGYRLAATLGHHIVDPCPALVPLECTDQRVRRLAGLELRNVELRVFIDGKRRAKAFGEMAFTTTGLGGPLILTWSGAIVKALNQGKKVELAIDLKPVLDPVKLDARICRDLQSRQGEPVATLLGGLLPRQLIPLCLECCELPEDLDTRRFPGKARSRLVHWLKDFRVPVSGYRSWDEAIITAGGVSLKEVDPRTMESKLVRGLFFAGEILDLQADTGGYNLQAAFSTGWLAGSSIH